jgi:magnesium-transporting ATPase (P-type)
MEGRGTMLVTAVGPNSQQGRIFALMRGIEEESGQPSFKNQFDRF